MIRVKWRRLVLFYYLRVYNCLGAFYTNLTYIEHEEGVRSKWISGLYFTPALHQKTDEARQATRSSSSTGFDQSSPNARHQIMRLHARLDLDSLPVAGPDERLLGDPVKPTIAEHTRPDEPPKPWNEAMPTVSCPMSSDGRYSSWDSRSGTHTGQPSSRYPYSDNAPRRRARRRASGACTDAEPAHPGPGWSTGRPVRYYQEPKKRGGKREGAPTSTCMQTTQSTLPSTTP